MSSYFNIVVVQSLSCVRLFATSWTVVLHHPLELAQTHVHWVGDAIQPSHPLSSLLLLPSLFPSIKVFSSESVLLIRWPKYWSFNFSTHLSMDIQDWFPLGLTGMISLLSKGLSGVSSSTTVRSINSSALSFSYGSTLTSTWLQEKL